jgi:hypothetical protein
MSVEAHKLAAEVHLAAFELPFLPSLAVKTGKKTLNQPMLRRWVAKATGLG